MEGLRWDEEGGQDDWTSKTREIVTMCSQIATEAAAVVNQWAKSGLQHWSNMICADDP